MHEQATMSADIGELATALALAQGEMESADKSSTNPAFKSRYADLAEVWKACREPLSKYGLSVVQLPLPAEDNRLHLRTLLLHKSGQWIAGEISMPMAKQDPQGYGSAMTYARRYGLAAVVGIVQDDDDGNAATANGQAEPRQRQQTSRPAAPTAPPAADMTSVAPLLKALQDEFGWDGEQKRAFAVSIGLPADPKAWSPAQIAALAKALTQTLADLRGQTTTAPDANATDADNIVDPFAGPDEE